MGLGAVGQRRVQASEPEHDGRLTGPLGDDMRPALRTKAAQLAGRGLEAGQEVLTSGPAEMLARHRRDGREGRAMRLSAGPAMAVHDRSGRRVDLVGDASAHAAADEQSRSLRPTRDLSKPSQLAPTPP